MIKNHSVAYIYILFICFTFCTPPKLPLYIGKGYDILTGNPLSSEGVDPGFQHEIIQFTYNKNQTTEDGKFLVPDSVSHRKTTACSFSTQITQYRGTQSYQTELKTKAVIGGGYKGSLFNGAFSQSLTFDKIHNLTTNQNMTLTHASAECQSYEMSLSLFKPGTISQNFWDGVNFSFERNNWERFVEQFGTHFVYETIMGGRAVQEIQYSWKSVSEMESLTIDIDIAAKASFAKFYVDSSFDYTKYQTQIKYAESLSQTIHQIYIGGQPPKTGKISDWQQLIINDPMPITYKMLPLSDLFLFHPNSSFDSKAAQKQFLAALDQYCLSNKCQQPTPDKPKPAPATVTTQKAADYGGTGGGDFSWSMVHPTLNARAFFMRAGSQIDNIQIQLSDGVSTVLSPQFGGTGGSARDVWTVPKDQYITQVEYRSGDRIDSLTFITNKGNKSPKYGGNGGTYHLVTFEEGFRIIGMFGRDGSRLDRLGFILGRTDYHSGQVQVQKHHLVVQEE